MILCLPFHMIFIILQTLTRDDRPPVLEVLPRECDITSMIINVKSKRGFMYKLHTHKYTSSTPCRKPFRCKSLLLIHGAYSNCRMWNKIAETVCRTHNVNVYAIDVPGFGSSEYQSDMLSLTTNELVDEIQELMYTFCEKLCLTKFVLVGHSFGGFISSLMMAHTKMKRFIYKCILVAPAGLFPVGARWAHFHAIMFRLKMISMIAPSLQNQGENLIMRFFKTNISGSYWKKPMFPDVLDSGIPTVIVSGSQDHVYNVEQALLVKTLARGLIKTDIVPLGTHYITTSLPIEQAILSHVTKSFTQPNNGNMRKIKHLMPLIKQYSRELNTHISPGDYRSNAEYKQWYANYVNFLKTASSLFTSIKSRSEKTRKLGQQCAKLPGNIQSLKKQRKKQNRSAHHDINSKGIFAVSVG